MSAPGRLQSVAIRAGQIPTRSRASPAYHRILQLTGIDSRCCSNVIRFIRQYSTG